MKWKKLVSFIILFFITLLIWIPLWMMISGSFMGTNEIKENMGGVLMGGDALASWTVFPRFPSLKPFVELLLDTPNFFIMFWNSCRQVFFSIFGQLLIGVPAAWAFARFSFRGKRFLLFVYIVLMVMPFQVTMVSSYLVLDKLNLMNTHWAIILPNIFSTFPVFIMVKFFSSVPKALIEAAKIDGAGEVRIFLSIGIPIGSSGIISAAILSFLEYWNALEQPLTFLKDKAKWPLSLYLPDIGVNKVGISLVASVIMMIPALLIFLYGQEYLEQGIAASGIKE